MVVGERAVPDVCGRNERKEPNGRRLGCVGGPSKADEHRRQEMAGPEVMREQGPASSAYPVTGGCADSLHLGSEEAFLALDVVKRVPRGQVAQTLAATWTRETANDKILRFPSQPRVARHIRRCYVDDGDKPVSTGVAATCLGGEAPSTGLGATHSVLRCSYWTAETEAFRRYPGYSVVVSCYVRIVKSPGCALTPPHPDAPRVVERAGLRLRGAK